jgi:hypothetical protein
MPFAYPEPWALKAEIVRRVRVGETLRAIGAEAGMPTEGTVLAWARADPPFRWELSDAMRRGAYRRVQAYDEVKAQAMLARLRAGETIHQVVGQPGMPSWASYRHWRRTEPPFLEAVEVLKAARRQTWSVTHRRPRRTYTRALADKVLAKLWMGVPAKALHAADPSLPGYKAFLRWRREEPAFDRLVAPLLAAWRTKRPGWDAARSLTPEMTEAVCERIVTGGTFRSIGDEAGMPGRAALRSWMRSRPDFAAEVKEACDWRAQWIEGHIDEIENEMAPGMTLAEMKAIRRRSAPYRRQLGKLKRPPGWRRGEPRD